MWRHHTIYINTLKPGQNGRHFPDDHLKCIFLNENIWISINISLKFVPNGRSSSVPALVQIMAWRRPGDKPLSEPMMIILLTHICVTRPQWVNGGASILYTYYKYTNVTFESMLQDTSGEYGDIAPYVLTMSFMFYSQSKPGIHESPVLSEVEL